ncbi:MAG TPA: BON domain-containing protein [Chloroflexota bacterium]|nr:BON domain-containing protein [Chloroflexota bacterium]
MSYLTDQEIIGAVTQALARDGRVNLADVIHITAENGVVRLTGTVPAAGKKQAAEDAIRSVHGVVSVENDLTVAVEGEISDAELRAAVQAALARSPELVARVGCRVHDGVVTLVGHIRDVAQEEEAIQTAGSIKGVEQVVSTLEIAEIVPDKTALPADDATLLGKLSEALDRAGIYIEGRDLHVDQGVATLRGRVDSEKARQRAGVVAASVDGIRAIHNRLVS